jgi:hypothetical protein
MTQICDMSSDRPPEVSETYRGVGSNHGPATISNCYLKQRPERKDWLAIRGQSENRSCKYQQQTVVVGGDGPISTVPVRAPRWLKCGRADFASVPLLHARPRPDDWRR